MLRGFVDPSMLYSVLCCCKFCVQGQAACVQASYMFVQKDLECRCWCACETCYDGTYSWSCVLNPSGAYAYRRAVSVKTNRFQGLLADVQQQLVALVFKADRVKNIVQ